MPRNMLALVILGPLLAAALTVGIGVLFADHVAPGAGGGLTALSLFTLIAALAVWAFRRRG